MAKEKKCPDCPEIPSWLTTFGDLMALLLTFFVLLLSFSTTSEEEFENAIGSLQGALGVLDGDPILSAPVKLNVPLVKGDITEARPTLKDAQAEIEKEIEASGQQDNVEVIQGPEGIIIKMKDHVLFNVGKAELKDEFKSLLFRIGSVLNRLPENSIEIEGHTDNVPITNDDFPNNHWLSSARALRVLDMFADEIGIERQRLAAMGYGEFQPLDPNADNDLPENRDRNRRVVIRVKYGGGETEQASSDSMRFMLDAAGLGTQDQ